MEEIQSESRFVWHLLSTILLLPFRFLGVLIGKQKPSVLIKPVILIWQFFWQAKVTAWIIVTLWICFFVSWTLPTQLFESLMLTQSKALSFNLAAIFGAGLLHGGFGHIIGNCLIIFAFGRVVEKDVGSAKTLLIYVLGFFVAHIGGMLLDLAIYGPQEVPGIGASGVMMGLVAVGLLRKPLYITYEAGIPMPLVMLGWLFFISDLLGLFSESNIGHTVHLGGLIGMMIIALLFFRPEKKELIKGVIASIISIAILIFAATQGLV